LIHLPRLFRLRWLVVLAIVVSAFVFSRDAVTAPQVIMSSITRSGDSLQPNAPEYSGCGGINHPVVNADYEQQVVDIVNTERANRSLPPYKRVTALDEAARYHSADLGQDNYWSQHVGTHQQVLHGRDGREHRRGIFDPTGCDGRLDEQRRPSGQYPQH
jgi:uncharacterized protein YkwD